MTFREPRPPIKNFENFLRLTSTPKVLEKFMAINGEKTHFCEFFRIFGANVRLGKIHSKLGNMYFPTFTSANRDTSQGFYHIEVIIIYVKNYNQLNFSAIRRFEKIVTWG